MNSSKVHLEQSIKKILEVKNPEESLVEILESFQCLELKKKDFLVREGNVCEFFCFIERGILQHSIFVSGEETTTYLALKNTYTSALKSFKNKLPSRKNIKALSDCRLWVLRKEEFDRLLVHSPAFFKFYYNLIENQIFLIDDYRIDLLTLSPEERYLKLLKNDPELLQQVSLRHLSSFLGISSRHMSRIRKNSI